MSGEDAQRTRSIELLEANHDFPTDYPLSVIALNADDVTAAVMAAIEEGLERPLAPEAHELRPSTHGKYVSHRVTVPCTDAAHVLAIYARLRAVQGVVTVL